MPNDRDFDPWDVLANVVGSLAALGLASAYHKRSLERRRRAKYGALTGEGLEPDEDLELGESGIPADPVSSEARGQETGVISVPKRTVEQELATWDENAVDDEWDEEDVAGTSTTGTKVTPASSSVGDEETPRKVAVD